VPLPARDGSDKRFFAADLFEASRLILHEGWTYQAVIDHFGLTIKRTTLMDNVRGIKEGKEKRPVGRPSALTHEEQTWLAQWILFCWALGLPPRRGAVLRKAAQILAGRGAKFATKTGLPSYQWWRRFSKRFGFEVGRSWFRSASSAASLTREALDSFYDLLFQVTREYDLTPALIWAMDETGFSRKRGETGVVKPKGTKAYHIGQESRGHVSLVGGVSAAGARTELFCLLKGQGKRLERFPLEGCGEDPAVCWTRKLLLLSVRSLAPRSPSVRLVCLQPRAGRTTRASSSGSSGLPGSWTLSCARRSGGLASSCCCWWMATSPGSTRTCSSGPSSTAS